MRPQVLVVDDHEDTLVLFVEELREANYDVISATNARDALQLALSQHPAIIVTDISMPDMDGCELALVLRSYLTTRDIPIVAVSAHTLEIVSERAPPGGWTAFVAKPFDPGELAAVVRKVLGDSVPVPKQHGPVALPSEPPPTPRSGTEGR